MMDKSKIAVDLFDAFAEKYQEKYMDISSYHPFLDRFCERVIVRDADILELACGPGNISHYLLKKRPDFHLLGTDLSPQMLELARRNNPSATFELMDCREVGKLEQTYDGIICGFGLPYLSKEEALQVICDAASRLKVGGVLYLSTMEDEYKLSTWQGPSDGGSARMFIHYHEVEYLLKSLRDNQLDVAGCERIPNGNQEGPGSQDLILIAQKREKELG